MELLTGLNNFAQNSVWNSADAVGKLYRIFSLNFSRCASEKLPGICEQDVKYFFTAYELLKSNLRTLHIQLIHNQVQLLFHRFFF